MFQSTVRSMYALLSAPQIAVIGGFIMKKIYTALFCCTLLSVTFADSLDQDSTKVEFFERIYKMDIQGVKPYEEYQDPDSFYSEIARKVGIPQVAHDAVGKRFGWKQDDKRFFYATMIKGGGASPDWGVMVTRVPVALQKAQSIEERKAILQLMEMKFVVISYDGNISFPDVETSGRKKTKPIHPNL